MRNLIALMSVLLLTACANLSTTEHNKNEQQKISAKEEELRKDIEEMMATLEIFCNETYPMPENLNQCFEKAKHGIAQAFGPHSEFMTVAEAKSFKEEMHGSFAGLGAEIAKPSPNSPLIITAVIPGTPADELGLKPGYIIESVNGRKSTSYETLSKAIMDIRGPIGSSLTLQFRRGVDAPVEQPVTVVRKKVEPENVKATLISDKGKNYGMIRISQFHESVADKVLKSVEDFQKKPENKVEGLIISLEGNPGGSVAEVMATLDIFLDAPDFVLYRDRRGITSAREKSLKATLSSIPGDAANGLPLLVVVDSGSASASEIFAKAIQHFGRGVIAGSSGTFQKGVVQIIMPLNDNDGPLVKINTAEYLIGTMDNWVPVQCIGVEPDILDPELAPIDMKGEPLHECDLPGSIKSGGPMPNAPKHIPIQEANPKLFAETKEMLAAYKIFKVEGDNKIKEKMELLKRMKK